MWGPIPAVAVLLAAAPSSMLGAGFQFARMGSSRVDYSRTYCVSFPEKGEAQPYIAKQCVPGTTFKLACNMCLCRQSGNSAICTKKNCYQQMRSKGCEPGSEKALECNICICSPAGRWACTQRQCRSGISYVACDRDVTETADARTGPRQCEPGSSFMNGCDRCYCANDGASAVCRSRPCNGVTGTLVPIGQGSNVSGNEPLDYSHGPDQMAGGGESGGVTRDSPTNTGRPDFQNETHVCFIYEGVGTICIELATIEGGDGSSVRRASIFKNETHICIISQGETRCYQRLPAFEYRKLHVCIPNTSRKVDCNICWCNRDGTAFECSLINCHKKRPTRDVSCTPGTTFMDECNTCWCGPDGQKAACTQMACPEDAY